MGHNFDVLGTSCVLTELTQLSLLGRGQSDPASHKPVRLVVCTGLLSKLKRCSQGAIGLQ